MKFKKTLFYTSIVIMVIIVFSITRSNKINYVSIGDSLSYGEGCYGEKIYGFSDYVSDYIKDSERLDSYINLSYKRFSLQNLTDAVEYNLSIKGKNDNFKRVLRESDLVTIDVGNIDISSNVLNKRTDIEVDSADIVKNLENMLITIRKYAMGKVFAIGFYNPYPYLSENKDEIDRYVMFINKKYNELCNKYDVIYIDIFDVFNNGNFIENPNNFNPNSLGYKAIYLKIIEKLDI